MVPVDGSIALDILTYNPAYERVAQKIVNFPIRVKIVMSSLVKEQLQVRDNITNQNRTASNQQQIHYHMTSRHPEDKQAGLDKSHRTYSNVKPSNAPFRCKCLPELRIG